MTDPQTPKVVMTDKLSAEWFADELNDLIHNAEGYGFTDEMVRMIEQRDAAIAAELVEGLKDIWRWSHWANEKLGFGDDPVFPEYIKARALLTKYGAKS